jgi:ACR3 family arsenite efflux pump ArsB
MVHFNKNKKLQWFKRLTRPVNIIAIIIGGILGYVFYFSTSCCSDEMALSLNPLYTVIYGGMTGMLISIRR